MLHILLACLLLANVTIVQAMDAQYLVGIGKADITGPAADVNLMGYAMPQQTANGIHTRLYARAFVFAEKGNPRHRVLYINIDACMSSQLLTMRVIKQLKAEFGDLYAEDNVFMTGTHTHASPAGFLQYLLYDITSFGFVQQSFDAMLDGILVSARLAHSYLQPSQLLLNSGELLDANINRSPTAYENNPAEERALYKHNVDKNMSLLKVLSLVNDYAHQATVQASTMAEQVQNTKTATAMRLNVAKQGQTGEQSEAHGPSALHARKLASTVHSMPGTTDATSTMGAESTGKTTAGIPVVAPDGLPSAVQAVFSSQSKLLHPLDAALASSQQPTSQAKARGILTWFPVHCTSMNNTNRLLSGDNKGAAELFFESWARELKDAAPGFVAAFAQSNVGDTSPNTQGAFCLDTGLPCDLATSTCNGRNELCHGRGPAWPDDTASTEIIGTRQAVKALELYNGAQEQVSGPIDFRHRFLDMTNIAVRASAWTREGRTCPAALGFSFAAGTTDGPGAFDFRQGDKNGTAFWKMIEKFILPPSREQQACQAPKPILINTGELNLPYAWQPAITEIGIVRIGQLLILCVPGEFTTMAGRRLRRAVQETVRAAWGNVHVVISGLTNTYSSYITTWEEYQVQRYEGAFTIYGPHTLDAYIQEFIATAEAMIAGQPTPSSVQPPDLYAKQLSFLPPVVLDAVPLGASFGDVLHAPDYQRFWKSGEEVAATFRAACPRNNLRINDTFLLVERALDVVKDEWEMVADDSDWNTRFVWQRHAKLSPFSYATIKWKIPKDISSGLYRIKYRGDAKTLVGLHSFEGVTSTFRCAPEAHVDRLL